MAILTRDQIARAADLRREIVAVPEWGGEVIVQALRVRDMREVRAAAGADDDAFALALVGASLVDDSGARLFGPDDLATLAERSATAFRRVAEAAIRVNGLDGSLGKDSATSPSGDTSSPSPNASDSPSPSSRSA